MSQNKIEQISKLVDCDRHCNFRCKIIIWRIIKIIKNRSNISAILGFKLNHVMMCVHTSLIYINYTIFEWILIIRHNCYMFHCYLKFLLLHFFCQSWRFYYKFYLQWRSLSVSRFFSAFVAKNILNEWIMNFIFSYTKE